MALNNCKMEIMKYSAKRLFLIDGLGALTTALLLSQVLARFDSLFGMPRPILFLLSGIAFIFAIYSMSCHLLLKKNFTPFLAGIATANVLYCILTSGLVIYYFPALTGLDVAYFVGEIIIILLLVAAEYRSIRLGG